MTTHRVAETAAPGPIPTVLVSRHEYDGDESFCSGRDGRVTYHVKGHEATLHLALRGLPPQAGVAAFWANDRVRGAYEVGYFRTDAAGVAQRPSLRTFRAPETRGIEITLETSPGHVVARLTPCSTRN